MQTLNNVEKAKRIAIFKSSNLKDQMYNLLIHGLGCYSTDDLYKMNSTKKKRITAKYKKAQEILNLYKQEVMIEQSNKLLLHFFTKEAVKDLIEETTLDPKMLCNLTFKDLGISKKDIIAKFLEVKLLPANFEDLK